MWGLNISPRCRSVERFCDHESRGAAVSLKSSARMDKGGRSPKTFVTTFRLDLKPTSPCRAERSEENCLAGAQRKVIGNGKPGFTSTDAKTSPVQPQNAPFIKDPLRDDTATERRQEGLTGARPRNVSGLNNAERRKNLEPDNRRLPSDQTNSDKDKKNLEKSPANSGSPQTKGTGKGTSLQTKESTDKGPPIEFLDPLEQVEVRVGQQARLHCAFHSQALPVACCWVYNRETVVRTGPRTRVTRSKTESSVEISQACPSDTGSYTLVVRSPRDTAQHTVSLSVIDCPDPPASHPVVSQLTSNSLVLSWTGPSYDGGSAVSGYVVEIRPEGKPGHWTEISTRCKNTSFRVHSGLEALGEYRFRVRAYNTAGVSEPSAESDCIKMATTSRPKEEPRSCITVTIDTKHKVQDHYDVHEKLGVGKFGQVYRLTHKETGQVCAGKFYRARSTKEKKAARAEINLMNCLFHPKLVQCLAGYDTRSEIIMVMEYIAGGELFERIVDESFEHTELTSARYMRQILEGMQYVHKQNIVHLDLKPENIVCVDTTGTQIKIIDFGLASKLEPGKPLMVMHGTPEFVAPEVINYEPVGLETDLWSIGVICFILLSGESPFLGDSDADTFARVTTAKYEFDEESFEDISDEAKEFIRSLLKKDRRCRLSCTEALAHPWMVSFTPLTRRVTKSLKKDKMRHFLAKRKWKKTGKAVLALHRMAILSQRPESPATSSEELSWSPEAERAIKSLEKEIQSEPRFPQALRDTTVLTGAKTQLTCLVQGYPDPEVQWLLDGEPVQETSKASMKHCEDGLCSLVLTDLEPSDSGVYTCRATNGLGAAACSAKLTVER